MTSQQYETLEIPCWSPHMKVGVLYDCRSDKIIPGITLWDKDTLKEISSLTHNQSSTSEVITEDSLGSKALGFKFDANAKLSFLGDLVKLTGSAKYLEDKKTSHHQARVSLTYQSQTYVEAISMDESAISKIQHREKLAAGIATHVVISVTYGADAVFVFDRMVGSNEVTREVEGSLALDIRRVKVASVGAKGATTVSEDGKQKGDTIRCTFHGDVILPNNPTTFEEAVKVYHSLPTFIKKSAAEGKAYGVPKKASLYPLSKLENKAARFVRIVNEPVVDEIQNLIESLENLKMTAEDLSDEVVAARIPGIKTQLSKFTRLITRAINLIVPSLKAILPKIRGGEAEESELTKLVLSWEKSPFNFNKLNTWLEGKTKESSILEQLLKSLNDCLFITKTGELERHIYNQSIKHVMALHLAAIITNDSHPFLDLLEEYLPNRQTDNQSDKTYGEHWFDDDKVVSNLREEIGLFGEYASANKGDPSIIYVVIGNVAKDSCDIESGANTFIYTETSPKKFQLPCAPGCPKENADFLGSGKVTVEWDPPKIGSENVQKYRVIIENDHNLIYYAESSEPSITLSCDERYSDPVLPIKVAAVCEAGQSKYSASN